MWLVSGTPISTSLDQLKKQAELLRLRNGFEDIHQRWVSNEEVVSWLRTHMIRHTKAMRIGGEVALALPEADCQTVRHAASCSLGSVLFPCSTPLSSPRSSLELPRPAVPHHSTLPRRPLPGTARHERGRAPPLRHARVRRPRSPARRSASPTQGADGLCAHPPAADAWGATRSGCRGTAPRAASARPHTRTTRMSCAGAAERSRARATSRARARTSFRCTTPARRARSGRRPPPSSAATTRCPSRGRCRHLR